MPRPQEKAQLEDLASIHIHDVLTKIPEGSIAQSFTINNKNIYLSHTQPHYGGIRHWILCPRCNKRRIRIYWFRGSYQCRSCTGLLYRSQSYDKLRQATHQKNKYELILDYSLSKPKWMRWSTFERIERNICKYDDEISYRLAERFCKKNYY